MKNGTSHAAAHVQWAHRNDGSANGRNPPTSWVMRFTRTRTVDSSNSEATWLDQTGALHQSISEASPEDRQSAVGPLLGVERGSRQSVLRQYETKSKRLDYCDWNASKMAAEGCYRCRMKEGLQQTLQSAAILRDFLALVSVIRPLTTRPITAPGHCPDGLLSGT